MKVTFCIIAVFALASLAVLTDTRSSSTSAKEVVYQYPGRASQIAQRKKARRPLNEPDSLQQYEQDKLKGWYRIDHA